MCFTIQAENKQLITLSFVRNQVKEIDCSVRALIVDADISQSMSIMKYLKDAVKPLDYNAAPMYSSDSIYVLCDTCKKPFNLTLCTTAICNFANLTLCTTAICNFANLNKLVKKVKIHIFITEMCILVIARNVFGM